MNPNQPVDPHEFNQLMRDLQVLMMDPEAYQAYCRQQDELFPDWLYGLEPYHQN